jgi:Tfp pilus assembly protein PilF
VSRIHDALRRGQQRPAPARTPPPRTAHADAVLAALGYRSDRPSRTPVLFGLAAALTLAVVLAWVYWPTFAPSSHTASVGRPVSAPSSPTSAPSSPTSAPSSPNASVGKQTASVGKPTAPAPIAEAPQPVVKPLASAPASDLPPKGGNYRPAPHEPQPSSAPTAPVATEGRPAPRDDFQLALYHHRMGEFEQALVQYKKVLQRDELNVEAHNNLGMLYQGKGLYEDAMREFQRVLAIEPSYATAHLNLSAAYLKLGRADAAAVEARAALAIDPRQSDALVNLALAQDAAGQPGDARLMLRRALEITPHHAAAHYNLAQSYERAAEPGLALDHYRQFLQYAGTDQSAYVADARTRMQALGRGNK